MKRGQHEFNTKKEKHGKKKRNMELVQHEKRATWKDCNINKVQYGNNATSTKYNTKIAQTKHATSKSAT